MNRHIVGFQCQKNIDKKTSKDKRGFYQFFHFNEIEEINLLIENEKV